MPYDYDAIPEFATRGAPAALMRVPPGDDIPLTPRVRRLVDSPAFRRLSQVSQLGLVRLVYPGAGHSRFEHSLGVYRTALDFLGRLAADSRFSAIVTPVEVQRFLAAALLHDVGHWPYCHPLEDICLGGLISHEQLARQAITTGPIAEALQTDWQLDPDDVADLIAGVAKSPGELIAHSMLSGPIDVDKIDYLARDSLHCGVPYGRHFDRSRLIASLCLNETGDAIAVTDKGRTAAELMVFARYVMFSEVYWHHAVRSATAMLQRAAYELRDRLDWSALFAATDAQFAEQLMFKARGTVAEQWASGLFGAERQLYKRLAQYSVLDSPEVYRRLARQPYAWLVERCEPIAAALSGAIGQRVHPHDVLIDAPPIKLEVQFDVDVLAPKQGTYRPLDKVSPVVRTLAKEQFDDYVKRVRIFVHRPVAEAADGLDIDDLVTNALDDRGTG